MKNIVLAMALIAGALLCCEGSVAAAEKEPFWRAFLRQFADYMQIMLLATGIVSIIIGQIYTGVLLIGLTLVNAVIGFWQEGKAEESAAAFKQMLHVQAKVRWDSKIVEVPAEELILRLETIRTHFNHIYPKFEVPCLLQASPCERA